MRFLFLTMDQKLHEGDKSCSESSSTPVKNLHIQATKHHDSNLVSPTPEKTYETLNIKRQKEPAKLPEKYRILSDLFNRMTTSVRLLNLRKKLPTFQNICRQVEKLTGRKLSYSHVAQMKFVLPEAVQIDKILLHNNKTFCMEPEIKVTLVLDVVEGHIEHSDYIALYHIFSSRLFKYVNTHSEGCDVPEAELPEPFNRKKITPVLLTVGSSEEKLQNVDELDLVIPSQLHRHFSRLFIDKDIEESTKTKSPSSSPVLSSAIEYEEKVEVVNGVNTPMKPPLLSVETPDLITPKRSMANEDDKVSEKVMASSSIAKRSLNFSKEEDESFFTSENNIVTLSGLRAHQQEPSNYLSDLVETVHNIFRSTQCSFITKSELVHKILANNLDIIENGEIEDQIDLLVNKVPEWISKKVAPSGDLLYNINKGLDLKSITGKVM